MTSASLPDGRRRDLGGPAGSPGQQAGIPALRLRLLLRRAARGLGAGPAARPLDRLEPEDLPEQRGRVYGPVGSVDDRRRVDDLGSGRAILGGAIEARNGAADLAAAEIRVEEASAQGSELRAADDRTGGDRTVVVAVLVLQDRWLADGGQRGGGVVGEARSRMDQRVTALERVPAEVRPASDRQALAVDLLGPPLPDVADRDRVRSARRWRTGMGCGGRMRRSRRVRRDRRTGCRRARYSRRSAAARFAAACRAATRCSARSRPGHRARHRRPEPATCCRRARRRLCRRCGPESADAES